MDWTYQKVKDQEQVFFITNGRWSFPNGGQCEGGPVQTVDVTPGQGAKLRIWSIWINPRIRTQPQGLGEAIVSTGVPVDDHQDVQNQFADTESIRVTGSRLCTFKKLKKTRQSQQPVESQKRGVAHADTQVQQVRWQNGAGVQLALGCPNVGFPQALDIVHHQALIQKTWRQASCHRKELADNFPWQRLKTCLPNVFLSTCVKANSYIHNIDTIANVVQDQPS